MNEELNINYNSNAIPNERKDIQSGGGVCIMPFLHFILMYGLAGRHILIP